ncbi:hypothetical protein NDU88_003794 [Pleurodeles waltl]|uniref:Uncharacterized protein n=1 Tax=Pleurodeles waltl TaxID=8319 RepID=A0AAV7KZ26_PLEWA|nr:hypothetical protein NDU88_003794 [Pleurodeles waltl]
MWPNPLAPIQAPPTRSRGANTLCSALSCLRPLVRSSAAKKWPPRRAASPPLHVRTTVTRASTLRCTAAGPGSPCVTPGCRPVAAHPAGPRGTAATCRGR